MTKDEAESVLREFPRISKFDGVQLRRDAEANAWVIQANKPGMATLDVTLSMEALEKMTPGDLRAMAQKMVDDVSDFMAENKRLRAFIEEHAFEAAEMGHGSCVACGAAVGLSEKHSPTCQLVKALGREPRPPRLVMRRREVEEAVRTVLKRGNYCDSITLIGQVMRETKGHADPRLVNEIVKAWLDQEKE